LVTVNCDGLLADSAVCVRPAAHELGEAGGYLFYICLTRPYPSYVLPSGGP